MIGGLCLLVLGSCSISRPHITNIPLLAFVCFFEGYGHGGMDAGRLPTVGGGGGHSCIYIICPVQVLPWQRPPILS